ncbi:hypothetical protein T08_14133, partial [Trichinella sp. T8]
MYLHHQHRARSYTCVSLSWLNGVTQIKLSLDIDERNCGILCCNINIFVINFVVFVFQCFLDFSVNLSLKRQGSYGVQASISVK